MKSYDAIKNMRLFGALQALTPDVVKELQVECEFNKRLSPDHHKLGVMLSQFKRATAVHVVLAQRVGKPC